MRTNKKQAAVRLFKKLSALRATLPNEEREILDNLIVVEEVSAHKLSNSKLSQTAAKADKQKAVHANRLSTSKLVQTAIKADKQKAVHANRLSTSKLVQTATKADKQKAVHANQFIANSPTKASRQIAVRVEFDPTTEEYRIQE